MSDFKVAKFTDEEIDTDFSWLIDRDCFEDDPFEVIGGYLKNYQSQKERIELPRYFWAYYQWCRKEGPGIDLYIMRCERIRGKRSFSDVAESCIYWAFIARELEGYPHPPGFVVCDLETGEPLNRPTPLRH